MSDLHLTNSTSGAAIFSRIFESSQGGISPELAHHILGLGFSTEDRSRMQELATKNRRGEISHQELEELDNYITAGDILAIWQSKARQALKQCQASSPRHG
jgi:hypothetical protein